MTTDNRTNEPKQTKTKSSQDFVFTEVQVEAAAKAMWDLRKLSGDPEWDVLEYGVKNEYRKDARAALVAAQGAATQAAKDVHEPNHDRVYCVRCGGNWPCQPAPVLPSSGVDEDALAGLIREAIHDDRLRVSCGVPVSAPQYVVIARAVAAWLEGQGGESRAQDSA